MERGNEVPRATFGVWLFPAEWSWGEKQFLRRKEKEGGRWERGHQRKSLSTAAWNQKALLSGCWERCVLEKRVVATSKPKLLILTESTSRHLYMKTLPTLLPFIALFFCSCFLLLNWWQRKSEARGRIIWRRDMCTKSRGSFRNTDESIALENHEPLY